MKTYTVVCAFCLLEAILHLVSASEEFPGSQNEEEVHVYKKYARYPPYFYMYSSPYGSDTRQQLPASAYEYGDDDDRAISQFESLPHRSNSKSTYTKLRQTLLNDLDPEMDREHTQASNYERKKKSSVSWLLAAAIRMCQKHPEDCLRQKEIQEHMGMKALMEGRR